MKKLETLALGELQPGMRMAEAITDEAGRVLMPAGAELSLSTIAALERRGIERVAIELEVEEDAAAREAHRQKLAVQLERRFRRAGEGNATRALYQAVAAYRMEHYE